MLAAFAVVAAFCVVCCFVFSFAAAHKVGDEFVYVVADDSVAVGDRWAVRVGAIDDAGRAAAFVGSVNGVAASADGVVVIDRAVRVKVDGSIDDVPFAVEFSVPVVEADGGWQLMSAPVNPTPRITTPAGVHTAAGVLEPLRPRPGDTVAVVGAAGQRLQLLVDGRAVDDLRVPVDARAGALVVVSASDSALPSSTVRTFATFVGGPEAVGLDPALLARVKPRRDRVGNVAPLLEAQRRQRQAHGDEEAAVWRGRLHLVDAALVVVVLLLAGLKGRQNPLWAAGAVAVVVALLAGLDAMLSFV